jgi:hypothetical protein
MALELHQGAVELVTKTRQPLTNVRWRTLTTQPSEFMFSGGTAELTL